MVDYLAEAKKHQEAGDDTDEAQDAIAIYLAGTNAALVALVERLDKLIEMGAEYGVAQLDLQARR